MRIRDAIVARFGLKTSRQLRESGGPNNAKRVGIFRIFEVSENEILLSEDDKHLDFRVSVLRQVRGAPESGRPYVVLSTVVHCNSLLGRAYILLIAPFHRMVVKSTLRRASHLGWPIPTGR